jgi:hypothetical protein
MRKNWQNDEILLLNNLLAIHGTDYDVIAKYLQDRTARSIANYVRQHWNRFPALHGASSMCWSGKAKRWTIDEATLLEVVSCIVGKNWRRIALYFPGRTLRSCSTKWSTMRCSRYPYPEDFGTRGSLKVIKTPADYERVWESRSYIDWESKYSRSAEASRQKAWSKEEVNLLFLLYSEIGPNWENIALQLSERTPLMCQLRYELCRQVFSNKSGRGKFSLRPKYGCDINATEARMIGQIAELYDFRWDIVADHFAGRTQAMCAWAYLKYATEYGNERVMAVKLWSQEEADQVNQLLHEHRDNWELIANHMGKHPLVIRAYVESHPKLFPAAHSFLRVRLPIVANHPFRKKLWSIEEIGQLDEALGRYGKDWKKVCAQLPMRSHFSVISFVYAHRERFLHHGFMAKSRTMTRWSPAETAQLVELVAVHGRNWELIKSYLPRRSLDALRRKYYTVMHHGFLDYLEHGCTTN